MGQDGKLKILLVDDQPAKLLSYRVILEDLGETLLQARNGREALQILLKEEIAILLVDVCMPDFDGFELASMVRGHPRFKDTAIIFVSAVHLAEADSLRGYEMGAVDYVSVPVIPEILRAKVRVFVDLYRKTRALEQMNEELERRVAERTAEVQAAIERQELLSREVDHRAKNAYAVIQSIISLTRADSLSEYTSSIHGRIKAMARAHTLLSNSRWEGADLRRLVREELAPYFDGEHVSIDGPSILLAPGIAQVFAISIHELATNAAKYGALSLPGGHVSIRWSLDNEALRFSWHEDGGPPVVAPERSGFGTTVINASIKIQLLGSVRFDWKSSGLVCEFVLARHHVLQKAATPPEARSTDMLARPEARHTLHGYRVLLVEDEPLVGLMIADILSDFGLDVTGPIGTLGEALKTARGSFDAAILDVNVAGQPVFPLADLLAERKMPLVIVTGYDPSNFEGRYADTIVMQKPIDTEALRRNLQRLLSPERRQLTAIAG